MTSSFKQNYYTPQEYLSQEETSLVKHEYIDGEIIEMTGGTPNHNEICLNFATTLKLKLRGQNAKIYMTDLRLWIPTYQVYTYPDIMVIKGEPILVENRQDTITNPSLIIEVLSKSTKNYDQGDKFDYYCSLATFQEYILVNQYQYQVKHYTKKTDQQWLITTYNSKDDAFNLISFDCEVNLSEIYEEINFDLI
ncbi:MAG: Uma2 family endonuclease [Crocosphaera sp.]|nr:Uma2 family endonuclease [Crocosphaera sp.]